MLSVLLLFVFFCYMQVITDFRNALNIPGIQFTSNMAFSTGHSRYGNTNYLNVYPTILLLFIDY